MLRGVWQALNCISTHATYCGQKDFAQMPFNLRCNK